MQDIWEIRVQIGNNNFRILGFFQEGNLMVLNHAFAKKTQKTPRKEIEIAEQRRNDYSRRKSNELFNNIHKKKKKDRS